MTQEDFSLNTAYEVCPYTFSQKPTERHAFYTAQQKQHRKWNYCFLMKNLFWEEICPLCSFPELQSVSSITKSQPRAGNFHSKRDFCAQEIASPWKGKSQSPNCLAANSPSPRDRKPSHTAEFAPTIWLLYLHPNVPQGLIPLLYHLQDHHQQPSLDARLEACSYEHKERLLSEMTRLLDHHQNLGS